MSDPTPLASPATLPHSARPSVLPPRLRWWGFLPPHAKIMGAPQPTASPPHAQPQAPLSAPFSTPFKLAAQGFNPDQISPEAHELLKKMFESIQLSPTQVLWIPTQDTPSDWAPLSRQIEGESPCLLDFSSPANSRQPATPLAPPWVSIPCPSPEKILQNPSLKRAAWTALLQLKNHLNF